MYNMEMISGQDKISIVFTFIVGLFAGCYLYLTGFATTFEPPEASTNDVYTQFVITGESYGECSDTETCLAFQLLENGSFRAIYEGMGEQQTKDSRIPWSLRGDLSSLLTTTYLDEAEESSLSAECRYQGTNYRFEITREGEVFLLDTCSSAIDYESLEWRALATLWNHMSELGW
jgi:hypothetical protein